MTDKTDKEKMYEQMDAAAAEAQAEIQQNFNNWTSKDLARWWLKWYLKAGHKRLGRIVVSLGKKIEG